MPAGCRGAGSVWLRGQVAPRGNLKCGDRSSYPNLLEPLAFGANSQQKIALSFGRGRSWRGETCFTSHCFPPLHGHLHKKLWLGLLGWAGEAAAAVAGTVFAALIWTWLWGRAAVSQQRWTPGWNRKAKKFWVFIFGIPAAELGEKIRSAPVGAALLLCLGLSHPKPLVPNQKATSCSPAGTWGSSAGGC